MSFVPDVVHVLLWLQAFFFKWLLLKYIFAPLNCKNWDTQMFQWLLVHAILYNNLIITFKDIQVYIEHIHMTSSTVFSFSCLICPQCFLQGEKDWQKYETARRLKKCVDRIRNQYREDWKSKEMRIRQRAVALYFIDKVRCMIVETSTWVCI